MTARYTVALLALLFLSGFGHATADAFRAEAAPQLEYLALYPALDGPTPALPRVSAPAFAQAPILGPQLFIVILAAFADLNFSRPVGDLHNVVFISAAEYFAEVSYGKMQLNGMRTDPVGLPERLGFYGGDSGPEAQFALIQDALDAASPFVEYADGQRILVLHAGGDEAISRVTRDIWSFATIAPQPFPTPQGTFDLTFAVVAEFDPLGAYVHEMAHTFGLPDLYAPSGEIELVGPWDLMAAGSSVRRGNLPSHPSAWSKIRLGWLTDQAIRQFALGQAAEVDLQPLEVATAATQALKVLISTSRYYLVEVRQPLGYDQGLPSFGVLIYSVDDTRFGYGTLRVAAGSRGLSNAAWPLGSEFRDTQNPLSLAVQSGATATFRVGVTFGFGTIILTVVTPFPQAETITINGVVYATDSDGRLQLELEPGTFELGASAVIATAPGTRQAFLAWSDGSTTNPRILQLVNDLTLHAVYAAEHLVSVVSAYDRTDGDGWYAVGSIARLSVDSPFLESPGVRRVFVGWTGDAAASPPVLELQVLGPLTVEAQWQTEFLLQVVSEHAEPQGGGWYLQDAVATLTVEPLVAGPPQTRYRFDRWEGAEPATAATATVVMSQPREVLVVWVTEFEVTLLTRDARGEAVVAPAPSLELVDANGRTIHVVAHEPVWVAQGSWEVAAVSWHGVDIAVPEFRLAPRAGMRVDVPVRVYPVDVSVRGWLLPFTEPTTVEVRLPDETALSSPIATGGAPELAQLPGGVYDLQVQGLLISVRVPVTAGTTAFVPVTIFSLFDLLLLLGVVGGIGAVVAKRRRGTSHPTRR